MAYALISTVTPGPVIKRQAFDGEPPTLAEAKGVKWIPDNPPSFDSAKQTRTESAEIPTDATEVPYTVSDIPLDTIKANRKAALASKRYDKETGGISINDVPIGTDREDQAMVTGALLAFNVGAISSIKWKSASGFVTLDSTAFSAVASAVAGHVQACFSNEATLSAAIDECETADEVLAVDIDEGWPS